jgi:ketosteroid isomerase-like protein
MPSKSDLEGFLAYASGFELVFFGDDWSLLEPIFTEDVTHVVHAAPPLRHDDRGRAAVIDGLRRSVHHMDRRFDARIPEVLEGPVTRPDGVWMKYALELRRAGLPPLRFLGEHLVTCRDGRIRSIEEWIEPGGGERAAAYLAEHDARLRPAASPAVPPTAASDLRDFEAALLRTLARSYGAAKSEQDAGAALALCSEDFVLETVSMGLATRDRKQAEQQLALFFAAFPDYRVTLEGLATGVGHVTAWGRAHLSWRGPFAGRAPSGRSASLPFVSVFGAAGGRLRSERFFFDLASLCDQIGLPLEAAREAAAALRAAGGAADA